MRSLVALGYCILLGIIIDVSHGLQCIYVRSVSVIRINGEANGERRRVSAHLTMSAVRRVAIGIVG